MNTAKQNCPCNLKKCQCVGLLIPAYFLLILSQFSKNIKIIFLEYLQRCKTSFGQQLQDTIFNHMLSGIVGSEYYQDYYQKYIFKTDNKEEFEYQTRIVNMRQFNEQNKDIQAKIEQEINQSVKDAELEEGSLSNSDKSEIYHKMSCVYLLFTLFNQETPVIFKHFKIFLMKHFELSDEEFKESDTEDHNNKPAKKNYQRQASKKLDQSDFSDDSEYIAQESDNVFQKSSTSKSNQMIKTQAQVSVRKQSLSAIKSEIRQDIYHYSDEEDQQDSEEIRIPKQENEWENEGFSVPCSKVYRTDVNSKNIQNLPTHIRSAVVKRLQSTKNLQIQLSSKPDTENLQFNHESTQQNLLSSNHSDFSSLVHEGSNTQFEDNQGQDEDIFDDEFIGQDLDQASGVLATRNSIKEHQMLFKPIPPIYFEKSLKNFL